MTTQRLRPLAAALVFVALAGTPARAQEANLPSLRAAAKQSPQDPAAALALGKALRRAGRFGEAATELGRGAQLAAAAKSGLATPLRYELARTRIDQRELQPALAACNAVPGKALVAACRAEAHLMQNRAAEALPEVQKALGIEASLYEAKVAEGRAFALQGKSGEAETSLRAAVAASDGRPEAHQHLGLLLLAQAKREVALVELRKAVAADAGDPVLAMQLGEALAASGNLKEAREQLASAARIRPGFAAAHAALAQVALDLGDTAGAEAAAIEAAKLDAKLFAAHVALGRVRVTQARWDDALKAGEAARRLIANSAAGELIVADAHAGKGDIDLAIEAYQKAFGLDRTDPSPLVRAARAATAAGRLTTAKGFADRAIGDFPKWAPAWVELGEVLLKQGDKARARSAWETALKSEGPLDRDALRRKLAALK